VPWAQLLDRAERLSVPSTDGVVLAVLRWAGDDDVVVLAHATGFHKELWLPTVDELRAQGATCTVVALDLRGHGGSTEPRGELSWPDFGRDVLAVVARVRRSGRLVGVGHSLGGGAVVGAEVQAPGTFNGLVLVDPAIMPPGNGADAGSNPWAEGARRRRARYASRAEAFDNFAGKAVFSTWPRDVLRLYVDHGMVDDDGGVVLACRPQFEALTFSRPEMVLLWDELEGLSPPVSLITAEGSQTHPPEHAEATAERARAQHLRLPGVSHFIPMEAPAAVARVIRGHLR
jgi:pimeloyl-ACP methyl ester carboxylesterase